MALASRKPPTPPPSEPERKGFPGSRFDPTSRNKKRGKSLISREFIGPAKDVIGPQKKAEEKQGVADLLIHGLKASKEKQKTAKKERRVGVMDIFLGLTPQKEKKSIPSKIKSSLFGKGEKVVKYREFEKFLKDPSLYRIDKLSSYQRKKRWKEIFKETGTGYLERWKVRKYFKDRALKPRTIKEKYHDEALKRKFLPK